MREEPGGYQAILFEVEGVLADTASLRRAAMAHALAAEGIHAAEGDLAQSTHGRGFRAAAEIAYQLAGAALDETALDLVVIRAEQHFDEALGGGLTLVPGAREAIEGLSGRARLAAVTRWTRRQAATILERAAVEPLIEFIIAAEDAAPKPSAEPYERALARLRRRAAVPAGAVLALEDGAAGIRSAAAAQLGCVAVGNVPAHEAVEALGVIPSLAGVTLASLERIASHDAEAPR